MSVAKLSHVTDWIFDVDNTLYPHTCNLFSQIDVLITQYVSNSTGLEPKAARKLQKQFYKDHGTTLNGLMLHHGVDPDHYLSKVHQIDYSSVVANPALVEGIKALPGRKFIFTNADMPHAKAVLARIGGSDLFDGMFDIRATGFQPKPERPAYEKCLAAFDVDPAKAVMFDDLEWNLKVPHDLGMSTVHILPQEGADRSQFEDWEWGAPGDKPHIHHVTNDLAAFLKKS